MYRPQENLHKCTGPKGIYTNVQAQRESAQMYRPQMESAQMYRPQGNLYKCSGPKGICTNVQAPRESAQMYRPPLLTIMFSVDSFLLQLQYTDLMHHI